MSTAIANSAETKANELTNHRESPLGFAFFTKRYFSQYMVRDAKGQVGNNIRFLLHSNGLCVVCLDPSHIVIQTELRLRKEAGKQGLCLAGINFESYRSGQARDRRDQSDRITGKQKKGALYLQDVATLCTLECNVTAFPELADEANAARESVDKYLEAQVGEKRERDDDDRKRFGKRSRLATGFADFKIPASINAMLLEVNTRLAEEPQLVIDSPLTDGYIGIINPRKDASFLKFELLSIGLFALTDNGVGGFEE